MKAMQPIHISRYETPEAVGYLGTIAPADRSWILWIDKDGEPCLWRRVQVSLDPAERAKQGAVISTGATADGEDTIEAYVPDAVYNWPPGVQVPEHMAHLFGELPVSK